MSGVITSPGYPNRYPLETECIWKITTDYGKLIEITIEHMNMEISHECRYDGVYISNTNDFQNNTLGKYCEKIKTPKTLTSNRHEVYIKFLSDMSSTSSGFKATYKTVTASMQKQNLILNNFNCYINLLMFYSVWWQFYD